MLHDGLLHSSSHHVSPTFLRRRSLVVRPVQYLSHTHSPLLSRSVFFCSRHWDWQSTIQSPPPVPLLAATAPRSTPLPPNIAHTSLAGTDLQKMTPASFLIAYGLAHSASSPFPSVFCLTLPLHAPHTLPQRSFPLAPLNLASISYHPSFASSPLHVSPPLLLILLFCLARAHAFPCSLDYAKTLLVCSISRYDPTSCLTRPLAFEVVCPPACLMTHHTSFDFSHCLLALSRAYPSHALAYHHHIPYLAYPPTQLSCGCTLVLHVTR